METKDGKPTFYAKSRKEWRKWLEKHSGKEKSVWLILYHKKSGIPGISLSDAVEEALCFGWIDSLCKKRDNESYYLTFSPRNKKSKWSLVNIERAGRMIKSGLMTDRGMEAIRTAQERGAWKK